MAVMSDADRNEGTAEYARECSKERSAVEVTKADLRAAYGAADDWVEANKAAFNTALPQPSRSAMTTDQKARLLMHIVQRRFLTGAFA